MIVLQTFLAEENLSKMGQLLIWLIRQSLPFVFTRIDSILGTSVLILRM